MRSAARGSALAEALVALALGGLLLGILSKLLVSVRRIEVTERASRQARLAVRATAAVLRSELADVSPASGDIVALTDTSVVLRAGRAFGIACAAPAPTNVVLRNSDMRAWRGVDPARDSALVLLEDGQDGGHPDWVSAGISGVSSAACPDGEAGIALGLGMPASSVSRPPPGPGTPVRTYELTEYRLYRSGEGGWWLGVRTRSGSGWAPASPVAGPLRARDGLRLRLLDSAQAPTTDRLKALFIEVVVRGESLPARSRRTGSIADSATALVLLRN